MAVKVAERNSQTGALSLICDTQTDLTAINVNDFTDTAGGRFGRIPQGSTAFVIAGSQAFMLREDTRQWGAL